MSRFGAAPHTPHHPHRTTMNTYDTNSHVGDTRERDFDREVVEALREQLAEAQEEIERLRKGIGSLISSARAVHRAEEPVDPRLWMSLSASINTAEDALDGGGDTDS